MSLTQEQKQALQLAVDCILEAADESSLNGAPSGVIYAALNQYGMTLDTYYQILGALERKGKIVVENDLVYLPKFVA